MTGTVEIKTPFGNVRRGTFVPGATLHQLYCEQQIPFSLPCVCLVNGKPVLRKRKCGDYRRWYYRRVHANDLIVFVLLPAGGDDSKNIIRTIGIIALAIGAAALVGPGGLALAGTSLGATGAALVQAGIVIGGSFLISALLPVKSAAVEQTALSGPPASPTYTLTPSGNQARLQQPIPKVYGRFKLVPDFAAQPYTKYIANEQFLYQVFCLGLGRYSVEEVRVGDVPVWQQTSSPYTNVFGAMTIEFFQPGEHFTTFDAAVDISQEVAGQELRNFSILGFTLGAQTLTITPNPSTGYMLTGFHTGDRIQLAGTGANDGVYVIGQVTGANEIIVTTPFPSPGAFGSGLVSLVGTIGPFAVGRPGRPIVRVEFDFVMPNGLGAIDDNGNLTNFTITVQIQARPINDDGDPLGSYAVILTQSYTNATRTPQRVTEIINLTESRYDFIVTRTTSNTTSEKLLQTIQWTGLKGFFDDDNIFADVMLMGVVMRAGELISSVSARNFSVIETPYLSRFNGTTWGAPQPSLSAAWTLADIMRNPTYGLGHADSEIATSALMQIDAYSIATGFTFNGVFDTQRTAWDALKTVAASVIAQPFLIGNTIGFAQDIAGGLARGVFTPRNVRAGSIEWRHVMVEPNSPNSVIVEYVNEETWRQDEIDAGLPGVAITSAARINFMGVTTPAHALALGRRVSASNSFRRVFVTFDVDMEGKLLFLGDPILVSHDVINWGQSGEVLSYTNGVMALSDIPTWSTGDHFLVVGDTTNKQWGPCLITPGVQENEVVLDPGSHANADAASGNTLTDFLRVAEQDQTASRYMFGVGTTYGKRCKVISIVPKDLETFTIAAVVDDSRVYDYASA